MSTPPGSLWWSQTGPVTPRPPLPGDLDVDVCIVGGGYTGLWAAHGLISRDPHLRVAVIEREVCGFGASGRNGGWASALFPLGERGVVRHYGQDAPEAITRLLREAVTDLGRTLATENIDADFHLGGTVTVARNEVQARRLRAEDPGGWLDAAHVERHVTMADSRGGSYSPHCARIHPTKLVRGLASAVASRGAHIFEGTEALSLEPARGSHRARVVTDHGTVRATYVVRATEGYTTQFPGSRRDVAPLYSLMIATEPLPAAFFDEVGLANYETFADGRHLVIYGQRTADNRLAFGGRGAPYHWGSSVRPGYDHVDSVFTVLESTLRELFPSFTQSVTHRWGGPLAMARENRPYATVDHQQGLAMAGGYTGDGVVLSRVCGDALAQSIVGGPDLDPRELPVVARPLTRRWEYEPWRWLGINAGLALARSADRREASGHESRAARWLDRLLG